MRSTRISLLCALFSLPLSSVVEAQNGNHYWSAFVSTRGGLFHNRFNNLPISDTNGMANVSASLAYARYTRSSMFTISGWTSGLFVSDFNFGNFSVSASGMKRVTPKANLHFGAGAHDGFNYQDLIINGIFFVDQGIRSAFATTGVGYDFTPETSGYVDVHYNHFRFDLRQEIDGSEFVFIVPGDEQVLIPILPDAPPFPSDTTENVIDASQLVAGLLAAEGVIQRDFTTESALLTGGLSHQFSERTDADVQLGYRWLDYQRPGNDSGGGDSFASLRLSHTFNTKTDASGAYTFRRNQVFDPAITSHTVLGRVNRQISVPIRIQGSLGFTYYPVPSSVLSGQEIIGGVSVSGEYVRTSFHFSYNRRAQHSIGIGRYLTTNLANGGVSYIFARDWSATAFGGYRSSTGTFDERYFYTVLVAGTNVRRRLTEEISIGGSYLFRYLDYGFIDYNTHLLSVFLTFGKIWK